MITCVCGAKWTGTGRAHCGGCHKTYTGIAAFDAHRKHGECLLPGDAGLTKREDGTWGFPESTTNWWEGRR